MPEKPGKNREQLKEITDRIEAASATSLNPAIWKSTAITCAP